MKNSDAFRRLLPAHETLLQAYRGKDFQRAMDCLQNCREAGSFLNLEILYKLYQARIERFLETPPAGDWDGVYSALEK